MMDDETRKSLEELTAEPSGRLWVVLLLGMMLSHCDAEDAEKRA